jgi:hypothetical protein
VINLVDLNVPSFLRNNGPVEFDAVIAPPRPPSPSFDAVSGLGMTHTSMSASQKGIGLLGVGALAASVGAAVAGENRVRASMRAVGVLALTIIYLGAAQAP